MKWNYRKCATSWVVFLSAGCAPELDPGLETNVDAVVAQGEDETVIEITEEGWSLPARSGSFVHELAIDGSIVTSVVDATDHEVWRFLDLDTGESTEDGWDLKFRRFFILTNGGVSGDGGVQVAKVTDPFEELDRAPEDGWTIDQSDASADTDSEPDNLFNNGEDDWYDYEVADHTLTSKNETFVVASDEGKFYKFRILDYYDEAGTPAIVRFQWAPLPGEEIEGQDLPDETSIIGAADGPKQVPVDALSIDASSRDDWVYLSVRGGVTDPADPATSLDWDLAFRRTEILTNGGSSGVGQGGAKLGEGLFEEISITSSCGFALDEQIQSPIPGAPVSSSNEHLAYWYDYDEATNRVFPGERSYIVRTAAGDYAKLRIWTWDDGVFQLSVELIEVLLSEDDCL